MVAQSAGSRSMLQRRCRVDPEPAAQVDPHIVTLAATETSLQSQKQCFRMLTSVLHRAVAPVTVQSDSHYRDRGACRTTLLDLQNSQHRQHLCRPAVATCRIHRVLETRAVTLHQQNSQYQFAESADRGTGTEVAVAEMATHQMVVPVHLRLLEHQPVHTRKSHLQQQMRAHQPSSAAAAAASPQSSCFAPSRSSARDNTVSLNTEIQGAAPSKCFDEEASSR